MQRGVGDLPAKHDDNDEACGAGGKVIRSAENAAGESAGCKGGHRHDEAAGHGKQAAEKH